MVDNIKDIKDKFSGFTPYINGYQNMKRASVLIPIIKKDNSYEILFEVRAKTLRSQPNEIAFPGGKIEKGDDPQTACIRETCEEIGITQDDIEIISPLDLYLNHSNLIIHPFLGIIKESALKNDIKNLLINKDEVDHVFMVPLKYLLENHPKKYFNTVQVLPDQNLPFDLIPGEKNYKFENGKSQVLFYKYKDYVIWGITAKILYNFLEFFEN